MLSFFILQVLTSVEIENREKEKRWAKLTKNRLSSYARHAFKNLRSWKGRKKRQSTADTHASLQLINPRKPSERVFCLGVHRIDEKMWKINGNVSRSPREKCQRWPGNRKKFSRAKPFRNISKDKVVSWLIYLSICRTIRSINCN